MSKEGGKTTLGKGWTMALRPDAQAFDEIIISTVPRYKESELSGDEWRISARIEFKRKGIVRHTEACRNVETACALLGYLHARACDDGRGYFASVDDLCDQEGCSAKATTRYRRKKRYCNEGHPHDDYQPHYRQFCDRHKVRGDCGFDDSDDNYEVVVVTE